MAGRARDRVSADAALDPGFQDRNRIDQDRVIREESHRLAQTRQGGSGYNTGLQDCLGLDIQRRWH
jgi:hypothetical protein